MLGEAGRHEESLALFRHGLEIDDLDERFYQGVMREAIALARPAEGIAAYQRLKRSLSILMGLAPSLASEALARTLMSL
jgi:DNA-binding SARP family transcriptional activator